ncbi:hypothetical protein KP509_28G068300 [Ceratopteris richardii]|nr:hypothetical protein KP509_28G068300 [Ceratopteris richardii]
MYARCNSFEKALGVFEEFKQRDCAPWNALIGVFIEHGRYEDVLNFLRQMKSEGTTPDAVTFVCSLKACNAMRDLNNGFDLHSEIAKKGYVGKNAFVDSSVVAMYCKCGALEEAKNVLESLPSRDTFTWTALATGYVKHGHGEKALDCLVQMQKEGITYSAVSFVCGLKACVNVGSLEKALGLHAEIARSGLLEKSIHINSTLVHVYSRCGSLRIAQEVFDTYPSRNEILWNALISGYSEQGHNERALCAYKNMQLDGYSPGSVTYICSLKACRLLGSSQTGFEIHGAIIKRGLEDDVVVGTALVDMYTKNNLLADAKKILDMMPYRNVVTWNALIAGYIEQDHGEEPITHYEQMYHDDVSPDAVTFICCAKACSGILATEKAHFFHIEASKRGLDLDRILGGALVDMYARFGWFSAAQKVFDSLSNPDDVTWNSLIGGYLDSGHVHKALEHFERMQTEGIFQDSFSFLHGLKAYSSIGLWEKGQELHIETVKRGLLETDSFLCSAFVDAYARCSLLIDAQVVLDTCQSQSVVAWNALLSGFVEHEHYVKVLDCYKCMRCEGIAVDAVTFICVLKACGMTKALMEGQEIHTCIVQRGLDDDIQLGTTLVDMYGKLSCLEEEEETFVKLPVRNIVSWNVLLTNFLKNGHFEQAVPCFEKMESEYISWDETTAVCALKAWANLGSADGVRKAHAEILKKGLDNDGLVGNSLIDVYIKVGFLSEAKYMFHKIFMADKASWNAMIAGHVEQEQAEEALCLYDQMQTLCICPDAITYIFILKACGCKPTVVRGREMHAEIVKKGFPEADVYIDTALIDMYIDCGLIAELQHVFYQLPLRNLATWNALLTGYVEYGFAEEVLSLFNLMQAKGVALDSISVTSALKACSVLQESYAAREIHIFIVKAGLDRESVLGNALVDMYHKCDSVLEARRTFDGLLVQDMVSWSISIANYAGHCDGDAALDCFEVMENGVFTGSAVTFASSLKACGSSGALTKGHKLHSLLVKIGLECEPYIGNAVLDMYSKCGLHATMQEVFNRVGTPDLIAWNSLIAGYAQLGESHRAFYAFNKLSEEDTLPDIVTFSSVLNACSNGGCVDEGSLYFLAIKNDFDCIPTLELFTCMVDLLARAGNLITAMIFIELMPFQPSVLPWHVLLGACRKWGDVQLGQHAFENAILFDESAAAAYVCLANIYADIQIAYSA